MFACTDQKLRAKHYDEFLNVYHQSLKEVLNHLGCDSMKAFPFTALVRQLKKFGKYGILIMSFIVPMLGMKNEDLPDTDELVDTMEGADVDHFVNAMDRGFKADSYALRVRGNLDDAFKLGFI